MRTLFRFLIFLAVCIPVVVNSQAVAISNSGNAPDSSAMLDIQSTSKGLLIPRMDSLQRTMINNPADGLLVYDTDSQAFWFRQAGQWTELVAGKTGLRDKDQDTKVLVEETPDDDIIRFVAGGHEYGRMDGERFEMGNDTGSIYIGFGAGHESHANARANTFIGLDAGRHLTFGSYNVAVGDSALMMAQTVGRRTAIGFQAGMSGTDSLSTYIGYQAGKNSSGVKGTYLGYQAGIFDTGYDNTIIGTYAGNDSLSGNSNTFIGKSSGSTTKSGRGNTFVGTASGLYNTSGIFNSFFGYRAGENNTTGDDNTIIGVSAGLHNVTGALNTFIGRAAGFYHTTGTRNTYLGTSAGAGQNPYLSGGDNTCLGAHSGFRLTSSTRNTLVGSSSGQFLSAGSRNTFVGASSGYSTTTGGYNVFIGDGTGYYNTIGNRNIFIGDDAGVSNSTGNSNTIIGQAAAYNNQSGSFNVAVGDSALFSTESTSGMVAVGHAAGMNSIDTFSTFVGFEAGKYATGEYSTHLGYAAGRLDTGRYNLIIGAYAGYDTLTGHGNTLVGTFAGFKSKFSNSNTFVGSYAGFTNERGFSNTFIGRQAGYLHDEGHSNTFLGSYAGRGLSPSTIYNDYNTVVGTRAAYFLGSGARNTIMGALAGHKLSSGDLNIFIGMNAGRNASTGSENVFCGYHAGLSNTTGNANIYIGGQAGSENQTGNHNTMIGNEAGYHASGSGNVFLGNYAGFLEGGDNKLYIDNDSTTTPLIYGDFTSRYATIHGPVGINVTSPDRELVVFDTDDNGDAVIRVSATNGSSREMIVGVNQGSGGFLSMETNNDLQFRTNGSSKMIVKHDGKVGIGTNIPDRDLTVFDSGGGGSAVINVKDATRELFLGVNSSGGSLRTLTNHDLSFWANGVRHMTVDPDGNVGIGVSNPEHPLHINETGTAGSPTIDLVLASATSKRPTILFSENSSGLDLNDGMSIEYDGSVSGNKMNFNVVGGSPAMTIESSSSQVGIGTTNPTALLEVNASTVKKINGGSWTASSDRRLKQDIKDYQEGLAEIIRIHPVIFRYNDLSGYDTKDEHIGVVAQELQEVAPHMVSTYEQDGEIYLQVDNSAMTYMLINAVKEQHGTILQLQQTVAKQKEEIEQFAELKQRIEVLEAIYGLTEASK